MVRHIIESHEVASALDVDLVFGNATLGFVLRLFWNGLRSRTVTLRGPVVARVGVTRLGAPLAPKETP